jgi:hypothetical protein
MNRDSQKRDINRFLSGKGRNDLDAFCIYQWVDRCHYEGWWDLALELGTRIPPNSIGDDYQKRLEYLLGECRKSLKKLNAEFIKVRPPGAERDFMVPKPFWQCCEDLGLSIGGKLKSGLRLELAGEKILFLQNMDFKGCIIRFYRMDCDKFRSWLRSHGFEHLIHGIIGSKDGRNDKKAKLRISWQDAENLMPSAVAELENDGTILLSIFFEAMGKVKNGTWGRYVDYVKDKYSALVSDEAIEKVRKALIQIASGLEGQDQFVERLKAD